MSLLSEVRDDPVYKRFKNILEVAKGKVDLEASRKEVLALHATRPSRNMSGDRRYSPKTIIDAQQKDMSSRSRMAEIRVRNEKHFATLREAMKAMRRHIETEYSEELKEDFKTVTQRKAFSDRVMKAANEFLAEGNELLSTIDFLIKDIDQANYGFGHIVDLLKLLEGSRGSRNV